MYNDDSTFTEMLVRAGISFRYHQKKGEARKFIEVLDENGDPASRFQFDSTNSQFPEDDARYFYLSKVTKA